MEERTPLDVIAAVSASDRPAVTAAAQQLSQCLSRAVGAPFPVRTQFVARDEAAFPFGRIFVASFTADVRSDDGMDEIERCWRDRLARIRDAEHERILLCTSFRRLAGEPRRDEVLERIRRLNRLVIALSRDCGSEIADIDRFLALCGGRQVGADYRSLSPLAAQLAGHVITAAILDGDVDRDLAPETHQRAIAAHGGALNVGPVIARYIGRETAQ